MRKTFPGHYRPTQSEFERLWEQCTFAFDANVLLNLYRYTASTRDRFLHVLEKLSARIWLPHQAATEYHENRLTVISQEESAYGAFTELLKKTPEKLGSDFRSKASRHSRIDIAELLAPIRSAAESGIAALERVRAQHPTYSFDEDSIRDRVTQLFDGRVGKRDAPPEVQKRAEARFKEGRPPGTQDKNKNGVEALGDSIIWLQLLEFGSKSNSRSLIFVTDDRKSDWWWISGGEAVCPLQVLIQEMHEAGVSYYQYTPDAFLKHAVKHLGEDSADVAAEEVRDVAYSESTSDSSIRPETDGPPAAALHVRDALVDALWTTRGRLTALLHAWSTDLPQRDDAARNLVGGLLRARDRITDLLNAAKHEAIPDFADAPLTGYVRMLTRLVNQLEHTGADNVGVLEAMGITRVIAETAESIVRYARLLS